MALFCGKHQMRNGQSLVDIMIGLALVTLAIGLATILVYGGQDILTDRENTIRAHALAHEGLEATRAILASDWSGTSDGPHGIAFASGTWTFVGTSSVSDIFTQEVVLTTSETDTRIVESVVRWNPTPERSRVVAFTTLATNWVIAGETGGDTGGGNLSGDWQNPLTLGSVDLGPGNSATDIDVKNRIVYMSAIAADQKKPDFFIIDASNGENPQMRGNIDTGKGLNAVDAAGTYAYVAHAGGEGQFQVIDVTNTSAPFLVTSTTLATDEEAVSIYYANERVYVGTEGGSGSEFYVVDVTTPSVPVVVGTFEVGTTVWDVWVAGGLAYLATAANNRELLVLNVADPAAITQAGSYDAPGTYDGTSVFASGGTVYLGRSGGAESLELLDVAALPTVTRLGGADLGGVAVNDIAMRAPLAFLGTSNANSEFQVWNVASSSSPMLWSSYNFPQVATGVDYEDNLVYVSVRSNDALRIITSSP
jgi:hypothetical protein